MENKINESLKKINFLKRYKELTETFSDLDLKWSPQKKDIQNVLTKKNIELIYSSKDKMFYTQYQIEEYKMKFLLSCSTGLVEGWIQLFQNKSVVLNSRFDFLGEKLKKGYRKNLKSTLPICSSEETLEEIIQELYFIYNALTKEMIQ